MRTILALALAGGLLAACGTINSGTDRVADRVASALDRLNAYFSEELAKADEAIQDSAAGTNYIADLWEKACGAIGGEWDADTPECVAG